MSNRATGDRRAFAPWLCCASLLLLSACGSDPRTQKDGSGALSFAPVRTDTNAEAALGAPRFPADVPVPAQGLVIVQSSYGDTTTYVFNAKSGLLTGIWTAPTAPGFTPPIPERHGMTLAKDEQAALVRSVNLAWGAHHAASGRDMPHNVTETVWLLDGTQYKALDGTRAGAVISAQITSLADKHKIVPDNHEK